ncbi:MAG: anaerobic ribonucleoside-triphosphate reductase activating protein [Bacteroidetes bacterium HGW-Bacteroidetes-1]|jgi:anaerobic ribonucleoside-triphosphate reductase activating protein|nr:MAG: anaerobic ribonucleoside-triphosphate reductase activating protein [Bacteroidetes bacterium HGW-Bacteroidetes-1]
MRFLSEQIVFQEIPKEISLAFEITNCPRRCKGCHTPELQQDIGRLLTQYRFDIVCEKYASADGKFLFSCVLFLGGEQHPEFISFLKLCKTYRLKTALYTGASEISVDVLNLLDYVKLGEYVHELGGLNSPTTNQLFLELI